MSKKKPQGHRRIRQVGSDDLESVLNALEHDELLTAWVRLTGADRGPRPASIEATISAIQGCGRSLDVIATTLLQVESETPKKHCFFGSIKSGDIQKLLAAAESDTLGGLPSTEVVHAEKRDDFVYITATRVVRALDWDVSGPRGQRIKQEVARLVRHPTVIRLHVAERRVTMTCPPLPGGAEETLSDIFAGCVALLNQASIVVEALPARACISLLLRGGARRVALSRGKFQTIHGRFHVASTSRHVPLEQVLASLLTEERQEDRAKIQEEFSTSLQRQTFESVTLTWVDENVRTRIEFLPVGAEFLFFWGTQDRSFQRIDSMLSLLYELAKGLRSDTYRAAWDGLSNELDGVVISPHEFASRYSVAADAAQVLVDAVAAGLVAPVYRLKADEEFLEQVGLDQWTEDLLSLRAAFSVGGSTVDGADPRQIRVGFKRTRHSPELEAR